MRTKICPRCCRLHYCVKYMTLLSNRSYLIRTAPTAYVPAPSRDLIQQAFHSPTSRPRQSLRERLFSLRDRVRSRNFVNLCRAMCTRINVVSHSSACSARVPPSKKRGPPLPLSHLRAFARSFLARVPPLPPLLPSTGYSR